MSKTPRSHSGDLRTWQEIPFLTETLFGLGVILLLYSIAFVFTDRGQDFAWGIYLLVSSMGCWIIALLRQIRDQLRRIADRGSSPSLANETREEFDHSVFP